MKNPWKTSRKTKEMMLWIQDADNIPEGDLERVLGEEHQVPAVVADARHPHVVAEAPQEAAHPPRSHWL